MPFARLTLTPAQSPQLAAKLAADLTDLIAQHLRKRHDLTSVLIAAPAGLWSIGASPQPVAAHLEVTVTTGTNSGAEKQNFLSAAMGLLRSALPGLHVASYVVVTEVAASDWGYDGQSQAARAAPAALHHMATPQG